MVSKSLCSTNKALKVKENSQILILLLMKIYLKEYVWILYDRLSIVKIMVDHRFMSHRKSFLFEDEFENNETIRCFITKKIRKILEASRAY